VDVLRKGPAHARRRSPAVRSTVDVIGQHVSVTGRALLIVGDPAAARFPRRCRVPQKPAALRTAELRASNAVAGPGSERSQRRSTLVLIELSRP
jgi:hypothetical protein